MNRAIKKVAILGSGIMGSRIACHFANIGVQVLLLDIAPQTLSPEEEAKGLRQRSISTNYKSKACIALCGGLCE
jgi:3-hydroxyacyl-CoA dehydrogenase